MDNIYSDAIGAGVETFFATIARAFESNPLLAIGAIVLILVGLLVPAQRRRRRR